MACCVMVSLVDSAGYHDHKHEPMCAIWLSQTPWDSLIVTEYNLARFHNMCKRAAELVTAALIRSSADLYHMDNHTRMMSIPLSRIGHISQTALHRSDCARSDRTDLPYSTLSRRIHTPQACYERIQQFLYVFEAWRRVQKVSAVDEDVVGSSRGRLAFMSAPSSESQ